MKGKGNSLQVVGDPDMTLGVVGNPTSLLSSRGSQIDGKSVGKLSDGQRLSHHQQSQKSGGSLLDRFRSKSKKENKNPKHTTQLMENDLVNIIYVEKGAKAPSTVQELVQLDKYVVLPKQSMLPPLPPAGGPNRNDGVIVAGGDLRVMRVVKPSQQQMKNKGKKIYFVGGVP